MMQEIIHIVDPFDVAWSGSALEALALYDLLDGYADLRLWAQGEPNSCYLGRTITPIGPECGQQPSGGTLVLVGAYYEPGPWLEPGGFRRVIVKYNSLTHALLFITLARIRDAGLPQPELVFPSAFLRDLVSLPGLVEPSPISLATFQPAWQDGNRPFTVGKMSRDVLFKHHEDDPSLYRMLAQDGCRLRIMGGTCIDEYIGIDQAGIELLPAGAEPAADFLRSLDCFFYRIHPGWTEAFGRVVLEAMACGLPVLCSRRAGYAEWIRQGENGFLIDTQEEAYDILANLRQNREMRMRIGRAARLTAESIYDEKNQARFRNWYLNGTPSSQLLSKA